MKKGAAAIAGFIVLSGSVLSFGLSRYTPSFPPGTRVGIVDVGGLSPEDAQRRLRLWWNEARLGEARFRAPQLTEAPPPRTWSAAGMRLDDVASVSLLTPDGLPQAAARWVGMGEEPKRVQPVFLVDAATLDQMSAFVGSNQPKRDRARARWEAGKVLRRYEAAGFALDLVAYEAELVSAFRDAREVEMPLREAEKVVPDAELDRIVGIAGEFSTRFSASNRPRSSNIRLATGMIDGLVLMPGERFDFNHVVGERTTKRGFRVAGIIQNGRMDEGVGGGICQVSTTLYNAALLADLSVIERRNHSLAVPYVPVGRDAAVSYGTLNLVIENSLEQPIALSGAYEAGRVTFRVLAAPVKGRTITIERVGLRSWSRGVRVEHDPTLAYGRSRVIDKGGLAHRVTTYRVVRQDGKVLRRERLGESVYPGSPRIVGRNLRATPPPPPAPPPPGLSE